jgi:hypothetical protein
MGSMAPAAPLALTQALHHNTLVVPIDGTAKIQLITSCHPRATVSVPLRLRTTEVLTETYPSIGTTSLLGRI